MTRDKAQRLVDKLDALSDPARGGTPHERAVAAEKARALRAQHGLEARARPRSVRQARAPRRPAYTAPTSGAAWTFDFATGESSPNVKVHSYRDRSNWHIEITDW